MGRDTDRNEASMDLSVGGGSSSRKREAAALMPAEIVQVYEQGGYVRVRVLSMPTDPADLGRVLMDAAAVCAEVYRRDEHASSAAPYLERIIEGIQDEIESPSGQVEEIHDHKKEN